MNTLSLSLLVCLFAFSGALSVTPRTSQSLIRSYYDLYSLQDPSGTYKGSKSVLGVNVDATLTIETASELHFTVTGPVSIDCDKEAYTFSNGKFTFPNIGVSGDCLHDALAKYGASLGSTTYDSSSDTIEVKVKYSIVTITIDLKHQSLVDLHEAQAPVASSSPSIGELVDTYYDIFALQDPSGMYTGSKTIMGLELDAKINVGDSDFSLEVTNYVSCPSEPYTYSKGLITPTNAKKQGDCINDQLENYGLTLRNITYDTSSDSITVHVTVQGFLNVSFTVNHQSTHHYSVAPVEDEMTFGELIDRYYDIYSLQDPEGTYKGSKSILGQKIEATIEVEDKTHFHFVLSGTVSLDCDNVLYSYSNGVISLPNIGKDGDCLHDALQKNDISFESVTYDTSADSITVKVKYTILTVSLELDHQSSLFHEAPLVAVPGPIPLARLLDNYMLHHEEVSPSGTYEGTKTILGQELKCTSIISDGDFTITFSGIVNVHCANEAFTYANGVITVTDIGKQGDCLHDAMVKNDSSLVSITFNEAENVITAKVKRAFLTVAIELSHK